MRRQVLLSTNKNSDAFLKQFRKHFKQIKSIEWGKRWEILYMIQTVTLLSGTWYSE